MTFFLNEYDPAKAQPRRGPNMAPTSFLEGVGAATSREMRDSNANFLRQRERLAETDTLAATAARTLGIEKIRPILEERNAKARAAGLNSQIIDIPDDPAEALALIGPNGSKRVLELARQEQAANPAGWRGVDLSEEGIDKRLTERRIAEDADEAMIRAMMPSGGLAADLIGGMIGATADVRNLPFLALGGGGGSFLRVMGREAALNATAEAVTLPSRFETAEELGKPDPSIPETLATAAIAGAALGGLFEGVARGVTYYRGRQTLPNNPGVHPAHTQAAMTAAEDALVAGQNPFKAVDDIMRAAPRQQPAPVGFKPEFSQFFQDSKAVTPDGKPLMVFHGTMENFDQFDAARGGTSSGAKDAQGAIFFTDNPAVAASYIDESDPFDGPISSAVNRLTGGRLVRAEDAIRRSLGMQTIVKGTGNVRPSYLSLKNPYTFDYGGIEYDEQTFTSIMAAARRAGNDGVIIRNVDDAATEGVEKANIYVVFSPSQVKSAFEVRQREPLITWDDPRTFPAPEPTTLAPDPITTTTLPDEPQTIAQAIDGAEDATIAADAPELDQAATDAEALRQGAVGNRKYPFLTSLKKAGVRINPDSPEGQELRSMGITARTMPGLFSRKATGDRTSLDTLAAKDWDERIPGLWDATGTPRDTTTAGGEYLDINGVMDVIRREQAGDFSWMPDMADAARLEADIQTAQRGGTSEVDDFKARTPAPGGLMIDPAPFDDLSGGMYDFRVAQIRQDLNSYMMRNRIDDLLPEDYDEIVGTLAMYGGDAKFLIERAIYREIGEVRVTEGDLGNVTARETGGEGAGSERASGQPQDNTPEPGTAGSGFAEPQGASERTVAGDQLLIPGVQAVSQRQRLEAQQARPMQGGSSPMDGGLFDMNARAQIDMFSDPLDMKARPAQDAMKADIQDKIEIEGDFMVDMSDGRGARPASSLLRELDDDDEFMAMIDLCGKPRGAE